ncbi:MAG TPA: cyanophycinase [Gemmatimonadaceae bacterium]|nr:cyanophycinase [Gemmatimonadaceae bacterium]
MNSLTKLVTCALMLGTASPSGAQPSAGAPKVGPAKGAVMIVGGGSIGRDIYTRFIELAGGPDALIIDVPTAGGAPVYPGETAASRALKAAGARNVIVLHTIDRKVADSDSFVAPIRQAGGVWFEGGRQWHLVDRYAGTQSEQAFREVLDRGGIVGGTSAGASILSTFLLRGAREGNRIIVAPQYLVGFGYLRGVAIDQHVVARSRLRDLADSLLPRYPNLLGISEDEGTAWLVRGDSAEIIGRNKAFVYGGPQNDPRRPFLTLRPGDRYDLADRRVISRAIDNAGISAKAIDDVVVRAVGSSPATVLVAQEGRILFNASYNVDDDSAGQGPNRYATYMPTTTVRQFDLGNLSLPLYSAIAQNFVLEGRLALEDTLGSSSATVGTFLDGRTPLDRANQLGALIAARSGRTFAQAVSSRLYGPIGAHRTVLAADGRFRSNVDELYRFELGLQESGMFLTDSARARGARAIDTALGWISDTHRGVRRLSQYVEPTGRRGAFMRFPDRRITVIVLTDGDVDAKGLGETLVGLLIGR